MTDSLISEAAGHEVFKQTDPRVHPILNHPEREICDSSRRLVEQDLSRFPNARILMQVLYFS